MNTNIEIMAPAGSWESLRAAIKSGANSVYFGVEKLNMRARAANNFTLEELPKIVEVCNEANVKSYLTLNIVLYDNELNDMKELCDKALEAGVSAVIASDIAAIEYANSIGLEVHISTQANVSNIGAVKFYSRYADVVVLARELTLEQIKEIIEKIKEENITGPSGNLVRVELFAHGALCVSISGKCYMSLGQYNHSANRGDCLQTCRRKYIVTDEETGQELRIDNQFVMSPKDLCTISFMDKLIDAGVEVFKIEGRGRSPDYVHIVVKAYCEAADKACELLEAEHQDKEQNTNIAEQLRTEWQSAVSRWIASLETVFNRGFWHGGYYLGKQLGEWAGIYGSKATKKKTFIGKVENYFDKKKVASILIETGELNSEDSVLITGPTTGVITLKADEIWLEENIVDIAEKGELISIKVPEKVRKGDKVYFLEDK